MEEIRAQDVTIEPMTLDDLDEVLSIETLSYPTPWSRRAFESELTGNAYAKYFVARKGRSVVGYIGMWVILEEAHITNVAVHPEHRRQGIGEKLMTYCFDQARKMGATRMTLEVRVSNITAQNLYRKLGFEAKGIRKGYYSDTNEDAIIMWKYNLGPEPLMQDRLKWMI